MKPGCAVGCERFRRPEYLSRPVVCGVSALADAAGIRGAESGHRSLFRFFFGGLFFFALLLVAAAGAAPARAGNYPCPGVVKVGKANVRAAPRRDSRRLYSLARGARVTILGRAGEWSLIRDRRRRRGWIFASLLGRRLPENQPAVVKLFADGLTPEQEDCCRRLAVLLGRRLAAPEKRVYRLFVSHLSGPRKAGREGLAWLGGSWLLVLRLPFSRADYRRRASPKLEPGSIDLLLYLEPLAALLDLRQRLLGRIAAAAAADGRPPTGLPPVTAALILAAENGDEAVLVGSLVHGLAAFRPRLIFHCHGFLPVTLKAKLPSQVAEFNVFALPPPCFPDGRRTAAALAWDFFGFEFR